MKKRGLRKFVGGIPYTSYACQVAVDQAEQTSRDFFNKYHTSKEEMNPCSKVQSGDPDYFSEDPERPAPASDFTDRDPYMAVNYATNGRNGIPCCVEHTHIFLDNEAKRTKTLQMLRPRLNPNESPDSERLFQRWVRDKAEKVNKLMARNVAVRNSNRINDMANTNVISDNIPDVEDYSGSGAKPDYTVEDLMDSLGNWEEEATERNEPGIYFNDDED